MELPPELTGLAGQRDAADKRASETARTLQKAAQTLAAGEARRSAATQAKDVLSGKLRERVNSRDAIRIEIASALAQATADVGVTDTLSWIETRRSELRHAKQARISTKLKYGGLQMPLAMQILR